MTSIGDDVEKGSPQHCQNANWGSHNRKQDGGSSGIKNRTSNI